MDLFLLLKIFSCLNMENKDENKHLWEQFCRLGERIGDGDLEGSEARWFNREYSKLARILIPELKEQDKEKRAAKAKNINEQMTKLLSEKKCSCGGNYKQSRSGSKIAYCQSCSKRVQACKSKS